MNEMTGNTNNSRDKRYNDAKKDLLEALDSFSKLDGDQKNQLITEFIGAEALRALYSVVRQLFG